MIVARSVAPDDMSMSMECCGTGWPLGRAEPGRKELATETGKSKSDLYKRALELRAEDQSG